MTNPRARIVKPNSHSQEVPAGMPTVFLAGSIDNGAAEPWQPRVEAALTDLDVVVFNPRRDDWDPAWRQDVSDAGFAHQVNWELDRIASSDVLLFYFSPAGPAPITLMEIGTLTHRTDFRAVVCCPPGYWRRGNVQVLCSRIGIPVLDSLDEAVERVRTELRLVAEERLS